MLDNLDRDIDQEIAAPEQRVSDATIVLARQPLRDELHAVLGGLVVSALLRRDDRDPLRCDADMPQDEWQDTLADAAKPDEENSPWKSTCTV